MLASWLHWRMHPAGPGAEVQCRADGGGDGALVAHAEPQEACSSPANAVHLTVDARGEPGPDVQPCAAHTALVGEDSTAASAEDQEGTSSVQQEVEPDLASSLQPLVHAGKV